MAKRKNKTVQRYCFPGRICPENNPVRTLGETIDYFNTWWDSNGAVEMVNVGTREEGYARGHLVLVYRTKIGEPLKIHGFEEAKI